MLDYLLSSNFGTDMLWFMELLFAVHAVISTDIPIPIFGTCSTIWLFNIANLKITCLIWVNHLFLWAIYTMAMLNN
jgi:hypothetical protein